MTQPLDVSNLWPGAAVAILGNAPHVSTEALRTACAQAHADRVIAVSNAAEKAPWADMAVAIDGNFPADFAGMRVIGFESDAVDALYVNMPHEVVTLGVGHVVHIRNNALAAIRLAQRAGAARIVLAGFDTARYEEQWTFRGLTEGLAALIAELRAQGVIVELAPTGEAVAPPDSADE